MKEKTKAHLDFSDLLIENALGSSFPLGLPCFKSYRFCNSFLRTVLSCIISKIERVNWQAFPNENCRPC